MTPCRILSRATLASVVSVASFASFACSSGNSVQESADGGPVAMGTTNSSGVISSSGSDSSSSGSMVGSSDDAAVGSDGSASGSDGSASSTAGWLYTKGNGIFVSNGGTTGTPWIGRGVNMDDLFMCGYNGSLTLAAAGQTLSGVGAGLVSGWKPTFIRISLSLDSYASVISWTADKTTYSGPMTSVIDALGANPDVYVLVTLRSDPSMIGQDTTDGNAEATGLPSDSTTTPDKTKYPTGTDATYVALVDTFANSKFVIFGVTNEPGGNKLSNATIASAMNHAVGTIRAEEDRLHVPHHLVSVQGNTWTSDISFYAATPAPITYDNVVYEVHYYPGNGDPASSYAPSSTLPVIIGEYAIFSSSAQQASFYADMESKKIPNLAWDFEPFSNCSPDLVDVTAMATKLTPTAWGTSVETYLLAH